MDRELVETITKLVIEVLDDMNKTASVNNKDVIKIWPHKNPLPNSIELADVKSTETKNPKELIRIKPYVKKE